MLKFKKNLIERKWSKSHESAKRLKFLLIIKKWLKICMDIGVIKMITLVFTLSKITAVNKSRTPLTKSRDRSKFETHAS